MTNKLAIFVAGMGVMLILAGAFEADAFGADATRYDMTQPDKQKHIAVSLAMSACATWYFEGGTECPVM